MLALSVACTAAAVVWAYLVVGHKAERVLVGWSAVIVARGEYRLS
jgi:hypothetical protein